MTRRLRPRYLADRQAGSITLELAILAPAVLVVLALVVVAGRITVATGALQQATAMAARDASLTRTPAAATRAATQTATSSLRTGSLHCTDVAVHVDTSGFTTRVGQPAQVSVHVSCTVALSTIAIPGIPGHRVLTAAAVSVLDTYRARTS